MFFSRSPKLGAVPAGARSNVNAITSVPGGIPEATSPGVVSTGVDGSCTSDNLLIYVGGTWRVKADGDICAGNFPAEITAEYVRDTIKAPLFVGPLSIPWDIPVGGEIQSYIISDPTTAPPELMLLGKNLTKDWGDPHFSEQGFSASDLMVVPSQLVTDFPGCDQTIQSLRAWLHVLGVDEKAYYWWMLPIKGHVPGYQDTSLISQTWKNISGWPLVPSVAFTHPITNTRWGIFTYLFGATENKNCSSALQLQYWVGPYDVVESYMKSQLKGSGDIWDITGLQALWDAVTDIVNWVGGLAGQLSCNIQNSICKAASTPATIAACLASAAACAASKPGSIDCTNPSNFNNPQCIALCNVAMNSRLPICTSICGNPKYASLSACLPWWKRWYVILPAIGVAGFAILSFTKKPSHNSPATS